MPTILVKVINWFIPSTSHDDESIDLEIINFYQYQNLRVAGEDSGKGQLVLTVQDGSERIIAEFAEFEAAFNLFEDIRDALEAGETYYRLE